jgi:hypothetical protein
MRGLQVAQVQFKFLQGLIFALSGDGNPEESAIMSINSEIQVRVDLDLTSNDG